MSKPGKKGNFSQKKRNLTEMEELRESGMLDVLSNRTRQQVLKEDEYDT
mgnify:FL=1